MKCHCSIMVVHQACTLVVWVRFLVVALDFVLFFIVISWYIIAMNSREKYDLNPKLCNFCNAALPYEKRINKFCDHSCASSVTNLGVCRNKCKKAKLCACCGEPCRQKSKKFCSQKCWQQWLWESRKQRIVSEGRFAGRTDARRFLIEEYGHKCSGCGITEWLGQRLVLVLDHINGNADDWSITNLRLICSNCDTLTPTYKGKNKGNGRYARMVRYREGKSF